MASISNITYTALAALGYTVAVQGTMQGTLPDTFITYQILDENDVSHADNEPTAGETLVQTALYSKDPAIIQAAKDTLTAPMKAAGFMRGSGRALPYDKDTGHFGYVLDFRYYESEEE